MEKKVKTIYKLLLITVACLSSCKSGPFNVFKSASPHEIYERKLVNSGLDRTTMGSAWIKLSEDILKKPLSIEIPYREKGYFSKDEVQAAAFSFNMASGQKLQVKVNKKPVDDFAIYTDVWETREDGELKFIGFTDTLDNSLNSDIDRTTRYVLRIQPELLAGGEYTLEISSGPSLLYPLKTYQNNQIRSFWGDGRDAGSRKHEGIDIFSSFRTPVLAIAAGTTRVNENNLGGKVVWLRPEGKEYTIYYAHLDEQTVSDGQAVQVGDTLGRMGNTGNARTTPPHLHFGVYTRDGAVDPLPYINPKVKDLPVVKSKTSLLNTTLRTSRNASLINLNSGSATPLENGTIVRAKAASALSYRIELPDGRVGYLAENKVAEISKALQKHKLNSGQLQLFDRPDSSAAVKLNFKDGDSVDKLGSFSDYHFVRWGEETGWIKQ